MNQLKLLGLLLLLCLLDAANGSDKEKCIEENQVCDQTDYSSYVECMRRRTKRDANCYEQSNECNDCDCDYCSSNECSNECSDCCESHSQSCTTRSCCHQTCHLQCRSSSCRRRCKSKCGNKVSSGSGSSSSVNNNTQVSKNEARHNITTIINLHNLINNTNIIDIPVNVNNTNINNITIEADNPAPPPVINIPTNPIVNQPTQNNCCNIIGPRQCSQTNTYPYSKCFHYRRHHCGNICQTNIMHAEPHQVCDQVTHGSPSCHQQIAYIPQPQPRCSYTSSWPYVSCGIPSQSSNCGGCYSHVTQGGSPPSSCPSSCYDEGYNVGPMYRQGPYFQQSYQPVAPCMYTGTCGQNTYQQQQQYMPQQSFNPIDNGYSMELLPNSEQGGPNPNQNMDSTTGDAKLGYNPFPNINRKRHSNEKESKISTDDLKLGYSIYPSIHYNDAEEAKITSDDLNYGSQHKKRDAIGADKDSNEFDE